jgi:glycosyltransferase involved in cell wall biosynthesis
MKISAAIITFNEERNIARVIESLRCCDDIVVVDSGSTDRTVELATKLGARVIESGWRGFAGQKNYTSECCENDWVLSLDADEALSEALEGEIWQIKKNGPDVDAYTMPRMAQYLRRWILHSGWYPDRKVRLYDRRRAKWVGDFVHESVVVEDPLAQNAFSLGTITLTDYGFRLPGLDPTNAQNVQGLKADSIVRRFSCF